MDKPTPLPATEMRADAPTLARQRLVWLIRPLGVLALLLWLLSPANADRHDIHPQLLLAFLFGAIYGVVFYAEEFRRHIQLRTDLGRERHNRLPEEYYFGTIDEIRVNWSK